MRDLNKEFTIPYGVNSLGAIASLDPYYGIYDTLSEAITGTPDEIKQVGRQFGVFKAGTGKKQADLYIWEKLDANNWTYRLIGGSQGNFMTKDTSNTVTSGWNINSGIGLGTISLTNYLNLNDISINQTGSSHINIFKGEISHDNIFKNNKAIYANSSIYFNNPLINEFSKPVFSGMFWVENSYIDDTREDTSGDFNRKWIDYVSNQGLVNGGQLMAPAGELVTGFARRSLIDNSHGTGWTFESGDISSNLSNVVAEISNTGSALFQGEVISKGGFKKLGSDDNYVLLAGGGTKNLSEIEPSPETQTTLDEPTLQGSNLILKYTGEDRVQQIHSIDLGTVLTDKTYTHDQYAASKTWVIDHNLNKYPSITIKASDGTEVTGQVIHNSLYRATVNFNFAFSGIATCN